MARRLSATGYRRRWAWAVHPRAAKSPMFRSFPPQAPAAVSRLNPIFSDGPLFQSPPCPRRRSALYPPPPATPPKHRARALDNNPPHHGPYPPCPAHEAAAIAPAPPPAPKNRAAPLPPVPYGLTPPIAPPNHGPKFGQGQRRWQYPRHWRQKFHANARAAYDGLKYPAQMAAAHGRAAACLSWPPPISNRIAYCSCFVLIIFSNKRAMI